MKRSIQLLSLLILITSQVACQSPHLYSNKKTEDKSCTIRGPSSDLLLLVPMNGYATISFLAVDDVRVKESFWNGRPHKLHLGAGEHTVWVWVYRSNYKHARVPLKHEFIENHVYQLRAELEKEHILIILQDETEQREAERYEVPYSDPIQTMVIMI